MSRQAILYAWFISLSSVFALTATAPTQAQDGSPPRTTDTSEAATQPGTVATESSALTLEDTENAQDLKGLEEANWVEQLKNPTPWLTWGGSLRLREIWIGNAVTLDKADPDHERHWQRIRTRVWAKIKPVDDFELNLRLSWEGKHYDKPESFTAWRPMSAVVDQLNFKWSNIGGSPITLKAGRQDIILPDAWLVIDGTPLDGSSTVYFDAVRVTTELADIKTKIDLIYFEQDAEGDHWIYPIDHEHTQLMEQDETGAIVYVTNNSLDCTQLDGYFIYKKCVASVANGDDGEIYTFGARVDHRFDEQWRFRGNFAGQFGHKRGANLCAFGALTRLSYDVKDSWKSQFRLDYEYLSGDDPGTGTNEAFDVLWGRYPRFSDLYVYSYAGETRFGDMTNLHRVGAGWTGHPSDKSQLSADYHLLFADQNSCDGLPGFSQRGCFRGQLLVSKYQYQITDYCCTRLTGELFFPGDYYDNDRNDVAAFARAELEFKF